MTVIHSKDVLLQDIYVNNTDTKQAVGFEFSSLNVSSINDILNPRG
jgi:galacturan 1,4-alpha-galacturonidase